MSVWKKFKELFGGGGKKEAAGIYSFPDKKSGKTKKYIGQSGTIKKRLQQHVQNEKLDKEDLENVDIKEVDGEKIDREIEEQKEITAQGGPNGPNLTNERNPIGENRKNEMNKNNDDDGK